MDHGEPLINDRPITSYESDDSSSSRSIFNRSQMYTIHKKTVYQHTPVQTKNASSTFEKESSNLRGPETTDLHKIVYDLSDKINRLKYIVSSAPTSPTTYVRESPTSHRRREYETYETFDQRPRDSPLSVQNSYEPHSSQYKHAASFCQPTIKPNTDQLNQLQELIFKLNQTLEHRDNEINDLRREINELRSLKSAPINVLDDIHTPTTRTVKTSTQNPHSSAFVPVGTSAKYAFSDKVADSSLSTPFMPFMMSVNNTLPNFTGREGEMPMKFINEFEVRATSLFGCNDRYLLRAAQQCLSDTALTWYIQTQQEQRFNTWTQFKQLFLRRFRTPEKIESLRNRLDTLWQGDNEPTADYFERLKSLISEIEPDNSVDYIKRKFLKKLRKDIRDKMPLGLASSLSDVVQKAIEIESDIIQQKIDDKLRDAHKELNVEKQKPIGVHNLYSSMKSRLSPLQSSNIQHSNDNRYDNINNSSKDYGYNQTEHKYSRTFTNSKSSPYHSTAFRTEPDFRQQERQQNLQVKSKYNGRWCSFCYSKTHNWYYCYSNPNGPNYQPFSPQHEQQQVDQHHASSYNHIQQQKQHYQLQPAIQPLLSHQPPLNSQDHYSYPQASHCTSIERHRVSKNAHGSQN